MQDAFVGSWARQPHLSLEMLGSLHDLNHRFLDLIGARAGDWRLPRSASSARRGVATGGAAVRGAEVGGRELSVRAFRPALSR